MKKFLQILAFVPFIVAPIACGTATDDVVDVVGTDGGSTAQPESPHAIPELGKNFGPADLKAVPMADCLHPIDCATFAEAVDLSDLEAVPVE